MWILTAALLYLSMTFGHADDYNERDPTGKVFVITGAGRGIGRALADNFLKNNASLIIIVDKNETGEYAASALNSIYGEGKVVFYHGDITTDLDKISKAIFEEHGYVDVLVNNAGVLNESDVDQTLQVNAIGTIKWGLRFFKVMRKDHGGKGGTIINVASISGFLRDPFLTIYKASKAAMLGFTYGLGHPFTYEKTGVRVAAICPGFTNTQMTAGQMSVDDQVEIFTKFRNSIVWQEPDHVGKWAVNVFKNADTATAWTIEENKDAELSPASKVVTLSALKTLEAS